MIRWQNINGIYQIYPRSFKDSNNDGVGDLQGIIQKLDYIKGGEGSLGIDAIWLSPFFRSPMADFGYDIADYCDVDPLFGTLDDFKKLLDEAHQRQIKVMIDYVPNHTSDQHSWFQESRSSKNSTKRDWYMWRDAKPDGSPPNNWLSVFGGSAWQLDETTGQYYLHTFLTEQPDLNWDNPEVRKAMNAVLDFWLSMGVDGIRADAVRWLSKSSDLRDDPTNPDYDGKNPFNKLIHQNSRYGEHLFTYLKEIAATVERYPDRIILFEDYLDKHRDTSKQYKDFYGVNPRVAAPFNFDGLRIRYGAQNIRHMVDSFQELLGNDLRPFYCFSNHDKSRLVSRVGQEAARIIGMLQLTLPGIPVVYYGDELGMHNVEIPASAVQDPFELQTPGLGLGRDPSRTPLQWSADHNAGFTDGKPWLPLASDYKQLNVKSELQDKDSFLTMYRHLLDWRHDSALGQGIYDTWHGENEEVFGYYRRTEAESLLIILNLSDKTMHEKVAGEIVYSTHDKVAISGGVIELPPNCGVILKAD
jgi:alpha-glucosidase